LWPIFVDPTKDMLRSLVRDHAVCINGKARVPLFWQVSSGCYVQSTCWWGELATTTTSSTVPPLLPILEAESGGGRIDSARHVVQTLRLADVSIDARAMILEP
jgi:hypothetical protein